ncbi:hypothetical protein Pyn_34105 [Prunus yedoensis var. nudiflora]|uniref:Uncharacterized protein n=1 Tax=Prunus yedoensis var. nudiflora TaxID=2094558 RepID=A0A314ZQ34_PRUYE|nr:hypothetical protein Pyn_34105 [Prunus yedoensis var. nudiflora]
MVDALAALGLRINYRRDQNSTGSCSLLLFIASSGISASAKRTGSFLNQSKMQDLVSNNGNNQLSRHRRLS